MALPGDGKEGTGGMVRKVAFRKAFDSKDCCNHILQSRFRGNVLFCECSATMVTLETNLQNLVPYRKLLDPHLVPGVLGDN